MLLIADATSTSYADRAKTLASVAAAVSRLRLAHNLGGRHGQALSSCKLVPGLLNRCGDTLSTPLRYAATKNFNQLLLSLGIKLLSRIKSIGESQFLAHLASLLDSRSCELAAVLYYLPITQSTSEQRDQYGFPIATSVSYCRAGGDAALV
ncbi:MAG TPA: hypothetical protein VFW73_06650 [Lacipirellulaceae bacterium]|nr:hypothetical protein [Lacipirellulaceae bacterium]